MNRLLLGNNWSWLRKLLVLSAMANSEENLYTNGDQEVHELKSITLYTPLTAGSYLMSAVVKSTDTEATTCRVAFSKSNDDIITYFQMNRSDGNSVVSNEFTLAETSTVMYLYASDNYWPHASGDTATFENIKIIYKGS